MNNIKLSTRIYFQQIMVVLALIGLGVYSLNNLQVINNYALEVADDDFPMMLHSIAIIESANDGAHDLLKAANSGLLAATSDSGSKNRNDYEKFKADYLLAHEQTREEINKYEEQINQTLAKEDEAVMLTMLKDLLVRLQQVKDTEEKVFQLGKALDLSVGKGDVNGINAVLDEIYAADNQLDGEMQKLIDFSKEDIARSLDNSKVTTSSLVDMLYIIVISASLFTIILTVVTGLSLRTLRKSVEVISGSVQQVATAAAQSGNAISMVSDGAKRQSESINQAVTAVEQSVTVLADVSRSAEEATELAKNAGSLVRAGKDKMDAMVRVVNRIQENSNKVNKITEIIAGIASQTNMLALNAAIEAARAGEQGKGFAVVADQVKSLAESSKSSVDDIVTLIEQAKADASEAVLVVNNVNDEMEKILESSRTTERMMQNISTAMEEQVSTTEELGQNMDTLRDIGTSNANAAEEITETIIELSRIASDTNQEIKKFNI